ncbi:MAG: Uma2 family endonuclease [Methylococcales bacterium]|nr:Uma2 family endonuclease [Methylococcales bacterium]
MYWQEVCEHPDLQNLPFKIELDKIGKIIMSPTKVYHSIYQGRLSNKLYTQRSLKKGEVIVACAIKTNNGTKVADVAWASEDRKTLIFSETECSVAPEICIEVLSDNNTKQEMKEKRALYFASGALEVWLCNQQGKLTFYNTDGKLKKSMLAPKFPSHI